MLELCHRGLIKQDKFPDFSFNPDCSKGDEQPGKGQGMVALAALQVQGNWTW